MITTFAHIANLTVLKHPVKFQGRACCGSLLRMQMPVLPLSTFLVTSSAVDKHSCSNTLDKLELTKAKV